MYALSKRMVSITLKQLRHSLEMGWLKFVAWIGLGLLVTVAMTAPDSKTLCDILNNNEMKWDDKDNNK